MSTLRAAYLIHGDDHAAVAQRRARLRALAEGDQGAADVEILDGERATPEGVATALATLTLSMGQRVVIVDGVERWKGPDVEKHLGPAMRAMAPRTTVAMFAREEGRTKAPAAIAKLVRSAGGQIAQESAVKPWELPKWVCERARTVGVSLDLPAARALVAQVGERQQRLLRELEKLAVEGDEIEVDNGRGVGVRGGGDGSDGATVVITAEDVEARAAHSATWRAFSFADALVGADRREATVSYLRLRAQGERLSGLTYLMAQRLREAVSVSERLARGASVAEVKRDLRMPPRAADRFVRDIASADPARLRSALAAVCDLERDTRGGAVVSARRSPWSALGEETLALRAIDAMTPTRGEEPI